MSLFLGVLVLSATADESAPNAVVVEIRELIQRLGDENFVIRERAGKKLLQIGVIAEHELRQATRSNDVEISLRANALLSQMEQYLRDSQSESVEAFVKIYSIETDPLIKLSCIWGLASPLPDYCEDGEGLFSLCRIVRFDKDGVMRNEAAKCLIAFVPFGLSSREKWYQNMYRIFGQNGDDAMLDLIHDYVSLRTDINKLRKKTETEVEKRAIESGESVDYPVKLPKSKELEDRLRSFAADLGKFQDEPLYSTIKSGNWVDILVFYALAEMYDELGMIRERDEVLAKALTMREKLGRSSQIVMNDFDDKSMNEHFRTAVFLRMKQRINWAEEHFKLVIEEADSLLMKTVACLEMAMIKHLMADLSGAIEYLEKNSEIVKSEDFKKLFNDSNERIKKNEVQILAYKAQLAAEKGDWNEAKVIVDKTLEIDPYEIDTIILRFKICERNSDLGVYKNQMRSIIDRATFNIRNDMERPGQNNTSGLSPHVACNQAAWLLANTNGDFVLARDLIEVAIKREPDSSTYLDTQAHVFALGKQFDKAIEIQTKTIKLSPDTKLFRNALEQFKKLKNNK
ncbi:MAG: hypothetical protein LBJ00_12490 [Planctomycetaceae bacterium]|nr:hypothetical protein [Planctomycetaceae bacterium]